jgi:hypothetical protein
MEKVFLIWESDFQKECAGDGDFRLIAGLFEGPIVRRRLAWDRLAAQPFGLTHTQREYQAGGKKAR